MSLKGAIASVATPGEVPAKIGNYDILGILGRGQSATIYLGREL